MIDHSNESSLSVLAHDAIYFSKFHKMKFVNLVEICFFLNLAVKGLINTPYYYGQFTFSLGKESPYIFYKFTPLNTATPR